MQSKVLDLPLLKLLSSDVIASTLMIRQYQAGDRIFEQGDETTGLWFVTEGQVAVERVEADGNLTTTGVWVKGDIVGIAGVWDCSGYPASARALSNPTLMGWIARDNVMRLHQEVPAFGLEISRMLSERLRYVQETISSRQGRRMVTQVAAVLLALSKRMGPSIVLTHEDIAHIIGTHRETVSRALRELIQQGGVRSDHGAIEIVDQDALEACSVVGR